MSAPPDARQLAATVVRRVEFEGAFAAAALSAEIDRYPQLESRDRAFATELSYGTLRSRAYLRGPLAELAPRGLDGLDPQTHATLLVAAYQLVFLPRVPARAAVHAAVEAVKHGRAKGLVPFVNAVLRNLARRFEEGPRPSAADATLAATPAWMLEALDRALGPGEGAAFVAAGPVPPPLGLRVRRGEVEAWRERLASELPGAKVEAGKVVARALSLTGAGDPRRLSGVASFDLIVHEEGSQAVAEAVGALPGERVLDACAGRGNKTIALADAVGPGGRVDAADLNTKKLERLRSRVSDAGVSVGETFAVDWSVGPGDVPQGVYDRVLVDVPCTGLGTLRRRPEILARRTPDDLARLPALQRTILVNAARAVRPGGVVLYAVCSVLREEVEDVVASLEGFDVAPPTRLTPTREGTDGYAMVRLVRGVFPQPSR